MTGVIVNGKPFGGPGGCLKGGVAIGGERSGNGSDGGDFGLLGAAGVGDDQIWSLCVRNIMSQSSMHTRLDIQ